MSIPIKVLFINPAAPQCDVHQYGKRFFSIMSMNPELECRYFVITNEAKLDPDWLNYENVDVIIHSVHPGIPNACLSAPVAGLKCKQIGLWHEGPMNAPFDAWIVSDPSKASHTSINFIGRPLPECNPWHHIQIINQPPHVGVSGFLGAWARDMVGVVHEQMPEAVIKLHLPYSQHMDQNGDMARAAVAECLKVTDRIVVNHDFMDDDKLLGWLSSNDLNCYIRPITGSLGVSSALDFALACHRPIAINKNPMFGYLHKCKPSICIEDWPLLDIMQNHHLSLQSHWQRNSREHVAKEILAVLQKVAA